MALRKEEFHYDPYEKKSVEHTPSAKRQRVTIDISAALIERIQAAASQQNLSVDQYLESLLDELVPTQRSIQQGWKPISRKGVEELRAFQEQLLAERGGIPFEHSVELLHEAREEREKELDF